MLWITLLLFQISTIHGCERYKFFKEDDVELQDHVITTITTPYVEVCWSKCVWIMNCFSINFRVNRFGMNECDLNNSSKKASPGKMAPTPGSQYHQMRNLTGCDNTECKIKEKLPEEWYRLGNSAIKMFHENKTWFDARAHCQSLGGDLLSISTVYENLFVEDVLYKIFSSMRRKKGDDLPGLVRYWPLDGSDDDVKLFGTPAPARYEVFDRKIENALYFPGFRTYAEVPAVTFNPEGFAFMLWVKPANQSAGADSIYSDWYSPHTFVLTLHRGYKSIYFWIRGENGGLITTYYLGLAMKDWNHIVVSWNKTENLAKVYLNGTLRRRTTSSLTGDIRRTTHSVYHLGIKSDVLPKISGVKTFHGYMKHLMVFNKSLDIQEIQRATNYRIQGPWIGLAAQDDTNTFKWSDGTNIQFLALPSHPPNPSFTDRKCVIFGRNGKWFDKFCNETTYFICEKPFLW